MDDDLELLERWRTGDTPAGQALFARHFRSVYRFFEHKVGADADDMVQRTFAACVGARDRFRGEASFRTYLFAIARKQLYSFLRQQPKGKHVDFEVTSIADIVTSLVSRLGRVQQIEQVRHALSQLPADQQLLLEITIGTTSMPPPWRTCLRPFPERFAFVCCARARRCASNSQRWTSVIPPAMTS